MIRVIGCDTARGLLSGFVDRELGTPEQVALDAHLRWCATCGAHAEDLVTIGTFVRLGAAAMSPGDAGDLVGLRAGVLGRLTAESSQTWGAMCYRALAEPKAFYAGIGATLGVMGCLLLTMGVVSVTDKRAADSMAAIMDTLSRPGSDGNPVALGGGVAPPRLALPRLFDDSPELMDLPEGDSVFAVATQVTRDGRVAGFEILRTGPEPMDLVRFNDAVARARFTPAQSGGAAVAVNMLWLFANTTVRGSYRPFDFEGVLDQARARSVG